MGLEAHQQVQVAGRSPAPTRRALAGDANALTLADAGRDVHLEALVTIEGEASPPARQSLLERELEHRVVIAAAKRAAVGHPAALAEQVLEEVREPALPELDADIRAERAGSEEVIQVGRVRRSSARAQLIAETVIALPLLGIGEDLV